MQSHLVLLFSLLLFPILAPSATACASGSSTVASLVREQFDRFILLQFRGPPVRFLMPFYTAYISALDAFVADRAFCPHSFGPCCLEQRDVDNFHAIHDRSLVDSKIATLRSLDPVLFYLPEEVVPDDELPPLTPDQQAEVDILWSVTQQALEDRPDSYVAVWSILPSGLNMLHDPRQSETCAEFEKYKTSADVSTLVTSVSMIQKVTSIALHGRLHGVAETSCAQLLFHATAFIFNGIRCEKLQNENLLVPKSLYPFYFARMNKHITSLGGSPDALPEIPTNVVALYLGDSLRVLSSYESWGRVQHLYSTGISTDKRNITEEIFSSAKISQILDYMLTYTTMTDAQRTNVMAKKSEADTDLSLQLKAFVGTNSLFSATSSSSLTYVYRQTVTCTVDLFHAYPLDPAQALSGCCADLCDQTSLLQTLTPPLSKADCCTHCNEADCDVEDNPSNPLSALEAVHLIPYYEGGSEVVNL